jgi:hypothetical protein
MGAKGNRHHAILRAGKRLGQTAHTTGITEDEAIRELLSAALALTAGEKDRGESYCRRVLRACENIHTMLDGQMGSLA